MGFRFRKSIKVLPGVRVNVSKSGPSLSVGTRGATVNVGKKGVRATVGVPGTGLSYSETLKRPPARVQPTPQPNYSKGTMVFAACAFFFAAFIALKADSAFMAGVFGVIGAVGLFGALGSK